MFFLGGTIDSTETDVRHDARTSGASSPSRGHQKNTIVPVDTVIME